MNTSHLGSVAEWNLSDKILSAAPVFIFTFSLLCFIQGKNQGYTSQPQEIIMYEEAEQSKASSRYQFKQ